MLVIYFTELENLPYSYPGAQELLKDNGLIVARSTVPGCRNAVDLTIEQTLNHSKNVFFQIISSMSIYRFLYFIVLIYHAQ